MTECASQTEETTTTNTLQMKPPNVIRGTITQTVFSKEVREENEYCVSLIDPSQNRMEEPLLNGESPTITTSTASNQQQQQVQLEESHEMITEGIYATLDQGKIWI